jgi:hypothetical protein
MPRGRDEDVAEILADAPAHREGLGGGGRRVGRLGVEDNLPVQGVEEPVQACQGIRVEIADGVAREGADLRVGGGEGRFAQVERVREALDGPADHPMRLGRLDLAGHPDRHLLDRVVGREGVDEIAEAVLARAQAPVDRRLDAPGAHMLTVVVARPQAQDLDELPDRTFVGVVRVVHDADAHGAQLSPARIAAAGG